MPKDRQDKPELICFPSTGIHLNTQIFFLILGNNKYKQLQRHRIVVTSVTSSEAYSHLRFGDSSVAIDVKEIAAPDNIRPVDITDESQNHQCKEGKNVMMGRKSKIRPGFIPLLKASNMIPLLIQKTKDVANLDILFAVQFSLLLLILLESNQTIALSSLGLQHKQEGETAWHKAMSSASRCSSPASYRRLCAKSREGHPKGRRGSESGVRS